MSTTLIFFSINVMIRMADPIFVDDQTIFLSKLFNFPEAPVWRAPIVRTESCFLPYVNEFYSVTLI